MAEKNGHGGVRPGAGRKSKADELGLVALLKQCCNKTQQKALIKKLAKDSTDEDFHTRHESRKLLMSYLYGKPKETVDLTATMQIETVVVTPAE